MTTIQHLDREDARREPGPIYSEEIDRLDWPSTSRADYVRDYLDKLKPVVITGAFEHWPARTKWTFDFFRDRHGALPLEIDGRKLTMAELVREVLASTPERPAPYLHNHLLSKLPAELQSDVRPMPACTRPNRLEHRLMRFGKGDLTYAELYIGGAGAKFPILHYDGLHTHAFLMQLQGEKEYVAFPPEQSGLMYHGDTHESANRSSIDDVEHPDLKRFPRFSEARGVRFKLHPGETLFVPSGWWHTVRILKPSITVSVNGASRANWALFCRDFRNIQMAGRPAKSAAAALYLAVLGMLLGLSGE